MVSNSRSVGYTIMGKTADLTVVQKDDHWHLARTAKSSLLKRLAVHRTLCSSTLIQVKRRKRCSRKKCTSNRNNCNRERIVKTKRTKTFWGDSQRVDCSWRCFQVWPHRCMQDMSFSCCIPCVKPLLNMKQLQKHLPWTRHKWLDCWWKTQGYFLWK